MSKRPEWAHEAKIAMLDRGVTQQKLADELGVSTQYVTNVITGRQPSRKLARRICEYLKIAYKTAV